MTGDSKGATSKNRYELTPAARSGLTAEVGTILQTQPEQSALQHNFMSIMQPGQSSQDPTTQNVLAGLGRAEGTVKKAGQQHHVEARDINQTVQAMQTLEPAARGQLQDLAYGTAGQVDSLVDPRFAFAFKPDVENVTEPGSGAQAMQYAQLALSIASIIAIAN